MKKRVEAPFQAVVAAPLFCVGVRCDEAEILGLACLPPRAELSPENALAAEAVRQLRRYFGDADFALSLPLQPAGTRFQRRVWDEIARIPNHRTKSYGELAKAVRSAPRAVGQACGANPYSLVVPCHRVIAAGGKLGGFARQGGEFFLEVKRWLLSHERSR
jgi:methylated-DNA-[protein]-cysteine S-methyltransferase